MTKRASALLVLAVLLSGRTAGAQALPSGLRFEGGAGVNGNIVTFNALPNGTGTAPLPGLPENLALQYRYTEEHQRSVPIAALAKLTLSLRF